MMKIGMFTFGGGYAMINLLDNEFVERKKWLGSEEFMNLVTIAESTPGPIAINCSTYIGYKKAGFLGALFATLGMCIPSFAIIYLISLFFNIEHLFYEKLFVYLIFSENFYFFFLFFALFIFVFQKGTDFKLSSGKFYKAHAGCCA